jgi:fumarylacetoacetate (FAA) hydrolase
MRYVTYALQENLRQARLGAVIDDEIVIDLIEASTWAQGARAISAEELPGTLFELIHAGPDCWQYPKTLMQVLQGEDALNIRGATRKPVGHKLDQVVLYPPLPRPTSLRDFYAFEGHVVAAHNARNREVPEEWYQMPVFYYSNPAAIFGPDDTVPYPSYSQALDFELEIACVIGTHGRDIPAEDAESHIFGFTVFNDWSARDEQRREMKVGLGPAKGKDFASSLGPWIVTPDELEPRKTDRVGVYEAEMMARINGEERSRGNWNDLHYSFAQMIERASADVYILAGEVLGSGTVGTGSLLDLTKGEGPWLQPGDVVELEVEGLGTLRNRIGSKHS